MRANRPQTDGFTLLEVILAIVIFVGAITVLSRLLIIGLENAELSDWQARAWLVAENQWAEIESGIRTISDTGPYELDEMPGWQWSLAAEPTETSHLYRVTIRVEKLANGPGQGRFVEFTRLFFDHAALETETST